MYIYRHPQRNQQRCKREATERLGWSWTFGLFPWRDYRWTIAHLWFGLLSLDAIYTLTHTCNLPSEGQQCFIVAKKSVITIKLSIWKNKKPKTKTNPFTVQRKHTDSDQYDSDWNLGVKVNKMIGTCTAKHGLLQMIILTNLKKNILHYIQTVIMFEIQRVSSKQDQGDSPNHCSLTKNGCS